MKLTTRDFLASARAGEPSLDDATRDRLRRTVMVATVGAVTTTATAANAGAVASKVATWKAAIAGITLGKGAAVGAAVVVVTAAAVGVSLDARDVQDRAPPTPTVASAVQGGSRSGGVAPGAADTRTPEPAAFAAPNAEDMPVVPVGSLPIERVTPAPGVPTRATSEPGKARAAEAEGAEGEVADAVARAAPSGASREQLDRELGDLDRARGALASGDFESALGLTSTAVPGSMFEEERTAIRIGALCGLRRRGEGRAALAAFQERYPRSLHARAAELRCR